MTEWFTSAMVFAPLFVISMLEKKRVFTTSWVFQYDVLNPVWKIARNLSLQPPTYETEEREYEALTGAWLGPTNMYTLMVTLCTLGFGLFKALVLYTGGYTRPLAWAIGMAIALGLYWLGLYRKSSRQVLSALFKENCNVSFFDIGLFVLVTGMSVISLLVLLLWSYRLGALCFSGLMGALDPDRFTGFQKNTIILVTGLVGLSVVLHGLYLSIDRVLSPPLCVRRRREDIHRTDQNLRISTFSRIVKELLIPLFQDLAKALLCTAGYGTLVVFVFVDPKSGLAWYEWVLATLCGSLGAMGAILGILTAVTTLGVFYLRIMTVVVSWIVPSK